MQADAGLTGVNFAIAETGGFVVCTNEGNADLGVSLPKLHIASMGIEKLIPRAKDLGVFLRLLARSATGQPITTYSSHFHGPLPGGELHIVLVDNGRSEILGSDEFRRSLQLHSLRGVHEHLPGLSPQRRAQLSKHRARPDRLDPGAGPRSGEVSQPAVCVQLVRIVHGRLPGEDRPAPSIAHLARRDRPARPAPPSKRLCMKLASFVLRNTLALRDGRQHGPLAGAAACRAGWCTTASMPGAGSRIAGVPQRVFASSIGSGKSHDL